MCWRPLARWRSRRPLRLPSQTQLEAAGAAAGAAALKQVAAPAAAGAAALRQAAAPAASPGSQLPAAMAALRCGSSCARLLIGWLRPRRLARRCCQAACRCHKCALSIWSVPFLQLSGQLSCCTSTSRPTRRPIWKRRRRQPPAAVPTCAAQTWAAAVARLRVKARAASAAGERDGRPGARYAGKQCPGMFLAAPVQCMTSHSFLPPALACPPASACRTAWYCGTDCSHADWRHSGHKHTCKLLAAARQAERAQQQAA